ncbi:cytochrome B [Leptolyngbya sp. 'hensonii']|uniref:cytochrome b n=1 Tax=Leptolyngbya sp. 'hensonii' TaxID=1922337 RepID=UPI00094FA19D|nr:cytochrome b/b6 domain-containing protein [Leptolyngbya sp. 'hensonii']OLP19530.1 cytochrome B [Leptolyngbya sp. 'hensonii']
MSSPLHPPVSPASTSTTVQSARPRLNSAFKHLMNLHWIMAACYLVLFTVGSFMARLPRGTDFRSELYDFHKAMGVLAMGLLTWRVLVLLRVWWRKYIHRLPRFTPAWGLVFILHTVLYLFMVAVPISGFFFSNSFKSSNVHFLGLTLPDLFPQNAALVGVGRSLHFWLAYTFLALILLHLLEQRKVVRALGRRLIGALQKRNAATAEKP